MAGPATIVIMKNASKKTSGNFLMSRLLAFLQTMFNPRMARNAKARAACRD
jgi:hypothetical protein